MSHPATLGGCGGVDGACQKKPKDASPRPEEKQLVYHAATLGGCGGVDGVCQLVSQLTIGGGVAAAPSLDDCLASIEVEWPAVRDVQPILRSKGKPTLQGTAPAVGKWLYAMAERIRGGRAG